MKQSILALFFSCLFSIHCFSQNWEPLNGPYGVDISRGILTSNGTLILKAATNDLLISKDKGVHWDSILHFYSWCNFKEAPSGEVYIYSGNILYRLNPDSKEMVLLNSEIVKDKPNLYLEAFDVMPNGTILAASNTDLLVSTDEGKSFSSIYHGINLIVRLSLLGNNYNIISIYDNDNGSLYHIDDQITDLVRVNSLPVGPLILYHSTTKNIICSGNSKTYISTNGGFTWQVGKDVKGKSYAFDYLFEIDQNKILGFDYGPRKFYISEDAGLTWKLDDSRNRTYLSEVYQISSSGKSDLLILGNGTGYYVQPDKNALTLLPPVNYPSVKDLIAFGNSNLIAKVNNRYQGSLDDGKTWFVISFPFEYEAKNDFSISSSNILSDKWLVCNFNDTIYLTDNLGVNWLRKKVPGNKNRCILANEKGYLAYFYYDSNYISDNSGESWTVYPLPEYGAGCYTGFSGNGVLYDMYNSPYDITIYVSKDFGQTVIKHDLPKSTFLVTYLNISNSNTLYWVDYDNDELSRTATVNKSDINFMNIELLDSFKLDRDPTRTFFTNDDTYCYYDNSKFYYREPGKEIKDINYSGFIDGQNELVRFIKNGSNGYLYGVKYQGFVYKSKYKLSELTLNKDVRNVDLKLTVNPNPFETNTIINLPGELQNAQLQIKIIGLTGKVHISNFQFVQDKIKIERELLNPGIYMLVLSDLKGKNAYAKLLIN